MLEGPAAALHGELVLQGNCLVVRADGEMRGVLWPAPRTRWDPVGIIHVGDASAAVGDEIVLDGGATTTVTQALRASLGWLGPPDPDCLVEPIWFAVELERPE